MLNWLLPLLPKTECYVEPFGGAASVLLNREPCGVAVYNDLRGDIVNFFRVLRNSPDELIAAIDLTPYSREEFNAASLCASELGEVERARRFYVVALQSFGGLHEVWGYDITQSYGNLAGQCRRWKAAPQRLRRLVDALKGVQIEQGDALTVIAKYDTKNTLFYCDPPYVTSTRNRRGYQHEMSDEDHSALAAVLNEVKGRVAVSGHNCALYDKLYQDWHKYEKEVIVRAAAGKTGGSRPKRNDVLWTNYNPVVNKITFT